MIEHFIFNVRPFTTDYQYLLFLSSSIGNEMKLVYLEAKITISSCLFIHLSTFMICLPCLPLSLSIHDVIEEKHDSTHATGLSEFNAKVYISSQYYIFIKIETLRIIYVTAYAINCNMYL